MILRVRPFARVCVLTQRRGVFYDTEEKVERVNGTVMELDIAVQAKLAKIEKSLRDTSLRRETGRENEVVRQVLTLLKDEGAGKFSYETALKLLSRHGLLTASRTVFSALETQIEQKKIKRMLRETTSHIFACYVKHPSQLPEATRFLEHCRQHHYNVSREGYIHLAKTHARAGDPIGAKTVIEREVTARGWEVGVDGWCVLLQGCRDMKEAQGIIERMRLEGVETDCAPVWEAVLLICARTSDARLAESVLQKIRNLGHQIGLHHYTILLRCHADSHNISGLSATYDKMVHAGLPLDAPAYVVLIEGLLPWAENDHVLAVCENAVTSALTMTTPIQADRVCRELLKHYAKRGDVEDAERLASRMSKHRGQSEQHALVQEAKAVRNAAARLQQDRTDALRASHTEAQKRSMEVELTRMRHIQEREGN